MTTAFVLSGGASLGSVQVGMLLALVEEGVVPDLVVGTSVGALNGGWVAARPDLAGIEALADLWDGLSRGDVFPIRPLTGLLGFLGLRPNLVPASGLRRLLRDNLEFGRLEDAPLPLHVVATDLVTGRSVLLSRGDAVDAITASSALPGIFPPVTIDGRPLVDGGVVDNTPLSHAVALGADVAWVLPTGHACALDKAPTGALAIALHALSITINRRLAEDVARFEDLVDVRVIPPLCPVTTSPLDFSKSRELIERSRSAAREWLATRDPDANQSRLLLDPHEH